MLLNPAASKTPQSLVDRRMSSTKMGGLSSFSRISARTFPNICALSKPDFTEQLLPVVALHSARADAVHAVKRVFELNAPGVLIPVLDSVPGSVNDAAAIF